MFDSLDLNEPPQPKRAEAYRVLARKYRPQTFGQLIGQDAMVQTLGNAIRRDRLAHAFLLTGVRGVGKTSTARLIAKALNCIGPDGQGGPTIDPCGICEPCVSIAAGRNVDVIEMDAASHTGVDEMRSITEIAKTASFGERYKVFIIDEVHMLSKNSFNAMLKTLEEPPANVKFLLATTEADKVPITILSRCQRFDLKRIPAELLAEHFGKVAEAEGVEAEPEALALIARAAEGSARDGLSILDQAIAHAGMDGSAVSAGQVRDMLGLSDRGAVRRLFAAILSGDVPAVLDAVAQQDALGVEPLALLRGLLETVHGVTRAKTGGAIDLALSVEEREAFADWASRLGFATLHRLWQLLLKGHAEVLTAPNPREAGEMALLRIIHASQLPDPGELARRLQSGEVIAPASAGPPAATASPAAPPAPQLRAPKDFPALIDMLEKNGKPLLAHQLHDCVGLIAYAPPRLAIKLLQPLSGDFARELSAALKQVTDFAWDVETGDGAAAPSLLEQERMAEEAARERVLKSPLVAATLAAFPEAELLGYAPADPRSAAS